MRMIPTLAVSVQCIFKAERLMYLSASVFLTFAFLRGPILHAKKHGRLDRTSLRLSHRINVYSSAGQGQVTQVWLPES
jgi:hypothetical protein